ncbi:MAG: dihydroneopterin aldolase [Verrucomicrobiota bacterium]|jgi:dihydroneopterin aldolase
MDQIIIKELEVFIRVGVPEAERAKRQRLLLTVEMDRDFSAAAARDRLQETIDYQAVATRLAGFGRRRSWKLIETLAVDMAEMVLREFKPKRVSIEIRKFILPKTRHVAVRITRPITFPS